MIFQDNLLLHSTNDVDFVLGSQLPSLRTKITANSTAIKLLVYCGRSTYIHIAILLFRQTSFQIKRAHFQQSTNTSRKELCKCELSKSKYRPYSDKFSLKTSKIKPYKSINLQFDDLLNVFGISYLKQSSSPSYHPTPLGCGTYYFIACKICSIPLMPGFKSASSNGLFKPEKEMKQCTQLILG